MLNSRPETDGCQLNIALEKHLAALKDVGGLAQLPDECILGGKTLDIPSLHARVE